MTSEELVIFLEKNHCELRIRAFVNATVYDATHNKGKVKWGIKITSEYCRNPLRSLTGEVGESLNDVLLRMAEIAPRIIENQKAMLKNKAKEVGQATIKQMKRMGIA